MSQPIASFHQFRSFNTSLIGSPSPSPSSSLIVKPFNHSPLSSITNILHNYDYFLIDCDGVIYNSDTPIEGSQETLQLLQSLNKKFVFLTNDSTKSRISCTKKINSLFNGLQQKIDIENIFCSSYLTAQYLQLCNTQSGQPTIKNVYVIGESGLVEELEKAGFNTFGSESDSDKKMTSEKMIDISEEEIKSIDAVVVGCDRSFNFYKICYASLCFQLNPHCLFVGTNGDAYDKLNDSRNIPEGACMIASLEAVTHKRATIVGKPSTWCVDLLMEKHAITDKQRMMMIGDRLDTDILLGNNANVDTMLVMSGVTTGKHVSNGACESIARPTYICPNLGHLHTVYKEQCKQFKD